MKVSDHFGSPSPARLSFDVIQEMKIFLITFFLLCNMQSHADIPKVTVHLLDYTDQQETKAKFWIDWSKKWRGIVSTAKASDEDAVKIIAQLRSSLKHTEAMHFCGHDPIYGIEATDSKGNLLKTSLCFSCLTWVKPDLRLDIGGKKGIGNDLCKILRGVIELPAELREVSLDTQTKKKDNKSEMATPRKPSD